MLFVVTGPSGTGKSYLIQNLLTSHSDLFVSPPLVTTRPARAGVAEVDRVSVSHEEFAAMEAAHDFAVVGTFQSNFYGFPAAIIDTQSKHTIINTWPALIPKFAQLKDVRFVGLTVTESDQEVLRQRMIARGDSEDVVANRMKQVSIDMADLNVYAEFITDHGSMFEVSDDAVILEQVLPWIVQKLS